MSKHVMPRQNGRLQVLAVIAVLVLVAVAVSVAVLTRQGAGGGPPRAAAGATASPAPGIMIVGDPVTFGSGGSGSARTALPTGARSGDLLVSVLSTFEFSAVTFGPGWTKAYELAKRDGVRMVVAWKLMADGDSAAAATVKPATQVSMATMAVRGVDPARPVEAAQGALGVSSPGVTTQTAGALLVLLHGSTGWQVSPTPPTGADLAARAGNNGNSNVAIAVQPAQSAGAVAALGWQAVPGNVSVASGTLAVRPAVPGSRPQLLPSGTQSVAGATGGSSPGSPAPSVSVAPLAARAPTEPNRVCDSPGLAGPASPPPGAVTVRPGENLGDLVKARQGGTTYWLAPGVHRLGTGQYSQVVPHSGDRFVGAPGAILDGQRKNLYAFTGNASDVTISHLTVQHFGASGQNNDAGVVNHDAGRNWAIVSNVIQRNAGAAVMLGSGNRLVGNCIRDNGQYGFNAYHPEGVRDVVLDSNEISGNNTDDWERRKEGCGCTGGGKFWDTVGAVVSNNYVHDNLGVGLWADSNNTAFVFQGNYISGNQDEGIFYETSYNAVILNNTFVRNALTKGPSNPGFPAGAVYLSESGGDARVSGPTGSLLRIAGNVFTDNWAGIVAWENADRFAGSPANTSTGMTTLVNPKVATERACSTASLIASKPYYDDCRWKTQNVVVENNTFTLDAARVPKCTPANGCGVNGVFSNYGTYPDWSPYKGAVVQDRITYAQNNVWRNNTYRGPWGFVAHAPGNRISWAQWRAAPYKQDGGSTLG